MLSLASTQQGEWNEKSVETSKCVKHGTSWTFPGQFIKPTLESTCSQVISLNKCLKIIERIVLNLFTDSRSLQQCYTNRTSHFKKNFFSGRSLINKRIQSEEVFKLNSQMASVKIPEQKVILVGDFGVGKSSLFRRFMTDTFVSSSDRKATLGEKNNPNYYKYFNILRRFQVLITFQRHFMLTIAKLIFNFSTLEVFRIILKIAQWTAIKILIGFRDGENRERDVKLLQVCRSRHPRVQCW